MPTFSVKYLPLPCSNFNDYFHPPNVSSLGPSVIQTEKKILHMKHAFVICQMLFKLKIYLKFSHLIFIIFSITFFFFLSLNNSQ